MNQSANIIPLFVCIPFAGAFLISIAGRRFKRFPDIIGNIASVSLTALSVFALRLVNMEGIAVYNVGAWKAPVGIALVLDALTAFMLVCVNLVACAIAVRFRFAASARIPMRAPARARPSRSQARRSNFGQGAAAVHRRYSVPVGLKV